MPTIRELAEDAANKCWDVFMDTAHTPGRDEQDDINDLTNIIEEALRTKRTKHDGDCSIYACREGMGDDALEHGICTCGYAHQCMWDGDFTKLYSQELEDKMQKKGETDAK